MQALIEQEVHKAVANKERQIESVIQHIQDTNDEASFVTSIQRLEVGGKCFVFLLYTSVPSAIRPERRLDIWNDALHMNESKIILHKNREHTWHKQSTAF